MTTIEKAGPARLARHIAEQLERARVVQKRLDEIAEEQNGLTFAQCMVVAAVRELGGKPTTTQLAVHQNRAVHTMTSAVNGLVKLGVLQRVTYKGEDRRIGHVEETPHSVEHVTLPLRVDYADVLDRGWSEDWVRRAASVMLPAEELARAFGGSRS